MAAVAEAEARAISERTKAALAAAKKRGVKLGSARKGHWTNLESRRRAGAKAGAEASATVRAKLATESYRFLEPLIREMREAGASYQAIADHLNQQGHRTRRGTAWSATAVWRLAQRLRAATGT